MLKEVVEVVVETVVDVVVEEVILMTLGSACVTPMHEHALE